MKKLMELYQDHITGAIKGLDRIRFRGTLRWLASESGIGTFLGSMGILYKDFTAWAQGLTAALRQQCDQRAQQQGIEIRYLNSGGIDKEALAREIAAQHGITSGPICHFSVLEPCYSPRVKGNRATRKSELRMVPSKCVHLYRYFDHPELGFGHVRLQSWLPFNVWICLNGRHWLERQLQRHRIGYTKDRNCFLWLEDVAAAQRLLDQQIQTDWPMLLQGLLQDFCPDLQRILPLRPEYYWSADDTEWATDIMFDSVASLDRLYPQLLYFGMRLSDSPSVMRYMGQRNVGASGNIIGRGPREMHSDVRRRYEGIRIKHWRKRNSIKMYNKSGSILRIETTINYTRDFKVFRPPNDDASRPASWQKLRKGVSDLYRRCEVSDQCNNRYGDALAAAQVEERLQEVTAPVSRRIRKSGQNYRGLNLWQGEDFQMVRFLVKGEHSLSGFRNGDLRAWLYPKSKRASGAELKRYAGRITRRIKLLRAHGLVKKVAGENRYMLTVKGQKLAGAVLAASGVGIKQLTEMAA